MTKDRIAYLYQRAEIDPVAVLKMKRTTALFSRRQDWYPTRYEAGKEPLELPKRKRIAKSLVINPKHFLEEDGILEIFMPGFGADENGALQPIATLEFEDGELKFSWITDNGAYEEATIPRDKDRSIKLAESGSSSQE